MADPINPFDRRRLRLRRDRAAAKAGDYSFLRRHAESDMLERLAEVKRDFRSIALLGATELVEPALRARGAETLATLDLSRKMLGATRQAIVADEEYLPFGAATLDLVIGTLTLHWVNDLPGCLLQIRTALKPDGFFLASLIGGETLFELRQVLLQAESETASGIGARVSPFADLRDMGALMQRAGFALPVIDSDRVTVTYPDLFALLRDLRGMGATSVLAGPVAPLSRRTLVRAAELYAERFSEAGRILTTFQIIHIAGWAPHESQQRPLRPGSAEHRLADALGTVEIPVRR